VDLRTAWEGAYPERPDIPIRIEAGAYRGRPAALSGPTVAAGLVVTVLAVYAYRTATGAARRG
jgi:hypothetical protein